MDLAYRARKEGFKCACCPTAFTFNEGGCLAEVDSFHERYYRIRNKIIFYWKNDKDIFNLVMPAVNKMLEQLEDNNRRSEFGLSVSEEATRQGILYGLSQIQKKGSFIPSIVDYKKGNIILIQ